MDTVQIQNINYDIMLNYQLSQRPIHNRIVVIPHSLTLIPLPLNLYIEQARGEKLCYLSQDSDN